MLREVRTWIDAIIHTTTDPNSKPWEVSYAGANELEPVLARAHDMYWANNRHPYDRSPEELLAEYNEDKEDRTDDEPEHHAH
jgi:hypothetical protein